MFSQSQILFVSCECVRAVPSEIWIVDAPLPAILIQTENSCDVGCASVRFCQSEMYVMEVKFFAFAFYFGFFFLATDSCRAYFKE